MAKRWCVVEGKRKAMRRSGRLAVAGIVRGFFGLAALARCPALAGLAACGASGDHRAGGRTRAVLMAQFGDAPMKARLAERCHGTGP